MLPDLRHRPTHLLIVGTDTEVVEVDEAVGRGGPGLPFVPVPLAVLAVGK
jgi:hypothetical protein